jgi:hypothetical protein
MTTSHLIEALMHFLQAGREHETLPYMEEPMATVDFIIALFVFDPGVRWFRQVSLPALFC